MHEACNVSWHERDLGILWKLRCLQLLFVVFSPELCTVNKGKCLWHAGVHASERGRLLHLLMIRHRPRPVQISCGVLVGDMMMIDLCYAVINKQWAAVIGTIMTV